MRRPLRRRNDRSSASGTPDHEQATRDRLRSVAEKGGYEYDEAEREEVEARLRRMFYGAKVEGSKAQSDPGGGTPG